MHLQKAEIKRPPTIYVDFFVDRPYYSQVEYIIYKVFRWFYVAFWFYFFPFLVLLFMYMYPTVMLHYANISEEVTFIKDVGGKAEDVFGET